MDISMQDDCIIEEVIPSKTKKLKQARLSFQTSCSSESALNVSTKKRKLESPGECKTPKLVKIVTNEDSVKDSKTNDKDSSVNKSLKNSSSSIDVIEPTNNEEETRDKSTHHEESNSNNVKSRRSLFSKAKKVESPSTLLTKFLKKPSKEEDKSTSIDDNIKEVEPGDISCTPDSNENSDKDSNVTEDEMSECKTNASERSNNIDTQQNDKSSDIDSESEESTSSDDEDSNWAETKDKESTSLMVRSPRTPKRSLAEHADLSKNKKVTPKQLLKKQESAKRREERERIKMEREKKREEERESRRKEKEEKRKEKEEKEKAEREQKRREKEQRELKKQMEMEQRQKEKEAKEQERRRREEVKEEERKRKEEEKLEAERKKQKASSNFVSFFVAKKQEIKTTEEENTTNVQTFMPFEVKADMRVAPICRRSLEDNEKLLLDEKFNSGDAEKSDLYLAEMKAKKIIAHRSGKTWPLEAKDDIILLDEEESDDNTNVMVQSEAVEQNRPKLLQFHENRRPPYWGTWRKRSKNVKSRRPFSKDSKWFDYEVDSDEEWEEEEPGESLHGSEDERDEENPDDNEYDVDNEFIVPHGYLSDEEARPDEEEEDDESMTPETQKFKLKLLGEQFEAERKEKTAKLKPKIIGCVWLGPDNVYPENTPKKVVEFLKAREAWVAQIPVVLPSAALENTDAECSTPSRMQTPGSTRKSRVPTEALPDLIRLIHGNTLGKKFLVREFLTFWHKKHSGKDHRISKASLAHKIGEIGKWIACPEEGQMHLKACWYVPEDIRKQHLDVDEELTLPNSWSYNLTPKRKNILDSTDRADKQDKEKEKKAVPLITQFTKKITQEEMKRQLSTKAKPILQRPPKRAVLISVPRKEEKEIPVMDIDEPENKKPNDSSDK